MPMVVEFFDVGHGNCTVMTAPNGKRMMIDCGHSHSRPWRPSLHYRGQEIELLLVTNFDEDHLSDYPGVEDRCHVHKYRWNLSIEPNDLLDMKADYPLGPGIQRFHQTMINCGPRSSWKGLADFGAVSRSHYSNRYRINFTDPNNLSAVSFLSYAGHKLVFPGDLEVAGWQKLLERAEFTRDLTDVNIFVASHHGRKSGCCAEVFDYCEPQIVVMSDREKAFDTQETVPWYTNRVKGVDWSGKKRSVLTTRNYGDIRITINDDGSWTIDVQKGM